MCTLNSALGTFITRLTSSLASFKADWVSSYLLGKEKLNMSGSASCCFIKMLYACHVVVSHISGGDEEGSPLLARNLKMSLDNRTVLTVNIMYQGLSWR